MSFLKFAGEGLCLSKCLHDLKHSGLEFCNCLLIQKQEAVFASTQLHFGDAVGQDFVTSYSTTVSRIGTFVSCLERIKKAQDPSGQLVCFR